MYNNDARYGAVLFDSEVTHDYGWACVSGEMPVRITGTHDLPSDTVWITNLGYDAAKVSGLQGSRFRRSGYMGHELSRLWGETGLLEEDTDAPARVPLSSVWDGQYTTRVGLRAGFSAWLLDRVMKISMDRVPMIAAPLSDLAGGIREVVLPSANRFFYKGMPPTEKAIEALTAANNPYQPVAAQRGVIGRAAGHTKGRTPAPCPSQRRAGRPRRIRAQVPQTTLRRHEDAGITGAHPGARSKGVPFRRTVWCGRRNHPRTTQRRSHRADQSKNYQISSEFRR